MRLIDADELIKNWYDDYIKFMTREEIESMDGVIENAPTINAIPIPKDATNGDMIKAIFRNTECSILTDHEEIIAINYEDFINWLNAPYEQEKEDA